jgi:hypothetical protein
MIHWCAAHQWHLFYQIVNNDSTVVEHLPHHFKVEGLTPATAAGAAREKMK